MNLIFWNISFADNVRAIKVNSTPKVISPQESNGVISFDIGCRDVEILISANLIFWKISFADNVRAIKVDSSPRLSYLRNQMVSSILIFDVGMMQTSISRT